MRSTELKLHNRPPHIHPDSGYYFLTVRTLEGQWFLQPDKYKQILLDVLREKTKKFGIPLAAYSIMSNHYHAIIDYKPENGYHSEDGQTKVWALGDNPHTKVWALRGNPMARFMREVNGASAKRINDADGVIGRKIWWNYMEHLIKDEADFYKHLNYIHQNPIKHGVSKTFNYPFSSYQAWIKKRGQEYLDDCFRKYPIIDFMMGSDEF